MSDDVLVDVMQRQYKRMWRPLREAIGLFPADAWRSAIEGGVAPVRLALHVIEALDYYFDASPNDFKWARHGDWEDGPIESLPSQEVLAQYLEQVVAKLERWLAARGTAGLLAAESGAPWPTGLDRAVYGLRHSQHHLGQLNADLRRRGLKRAAWA